MIELTESTIMHNTEANLERFHDLKALGVRLAIDDFGTGYSSLSYLHRFPIDILKIDRSFVGRLTDSDDGPELARAVVMLGETLGLETVAEGIEHEEQVAALLELGCVAGQGFLFAKAGSLEELSNSLFVARRNALWTAQSGREELSATGASARSRPSSAGAPARPEAVPAGAQYTAPVRRAGVAERHPWKPSSFPSRPLRSPKWAIARSCSRSCWRRATASRCRSWPACCARRSPIIWSPA